MKLKFSFSILVLIIAGMTFLLSSITNKNKALYSEINQEKNLSILYGEYVFKREKCYDCHTMHIDSASNLKYSLDGEGGTRPIPWFYIFLKNPIDKDPDSKMPSFDLLSKSSLNKRKFKNYLKKNSYNLEGFDSEWEELLLISKNMSKDVSSQIDEKTDSESEIFPLINFLDQIPSSSSKQHIDSINNAKFQLKIETWKNVLSDSNSILFSIQPSVENLSSGKLIYSQNCALCHLAKGAGETGPNLSDSNWKYGGSRSAIAHSVLFKSPHLPSYKIVLSPLEVSQLILHIESFQEK